MKKSGLTQLLVSKPISLSIYKNWVIYQLI